MTRPAPPAPTADASAAGSSEPADRTLRWLLPVLLTAAAVVAMVVALVVGGGAYAAPADGLPDAGAAVGWGLPVVRLVLWCAALLTVGWLLSAAVLDPQGRRGVLSPEGRRDVVRAAVAASVWCGCSLVLAALTLANVLGLPLGDVLTSRVITTYAWDVPQVRALLLTLVLVGGVAVWALFASTTGTAMTLLVFALAATTAQPLTGHSGGLGDHALATGSGVLHVLAVMLWAGGLVTLLLRVARGGSSGLRGAATSFGSIAMVSVVVVALSGLANAYTRMDSPLELVTTEYGRLVVLKALVLGLVVLIASRLRFRLVPRLDDRGGPAAFVRVAVFEALCMAVAMGVGVALARTPSPRAPVELPTAAEGLLGYRWPEELSFSRVVLGWRPDVVMLAACLVAAGLYVWGVARLRARGDRWPVGRSLAWLSGVALVAWVTNAGIAGYAPLMFSMHMVQHMTLSMLAPIMLVLGAPTTLALRAISPSTTGRRGPREWVVWAVQSPYARFLTHPVVVLLLYTVGLYGLYYSSIFPTLMGSHVGHVAMQVHFIFAGYLFYWVIIGIDPTPREVPYWGKLLLLILSLVIHSFFAVPMMMSGAPIAEDWYGLVRPPWLLDPLYDSRLGGSIAWGFGEVPTLIVLVALCVQWARSDAREAKRFDRKADRDGGADLAAYNSRLAAMNARAESDEAAGR